MHIELVPLPSPYISLRDAQEQPDGAFVNVVGVIVDQKEPSLTRGPTGDWQCLFHLQDPSLLGSFNPQAGLKVKIFSPPNQMPQNVNLGDLMLIRSIKLNTFSGERLLMKNHRTQFLFFAKDSIPSSDFKAALVSEDHQAIRHTTLPGKRADVLNANEQDYIIKLRDWARDNENFLPQPHQISALPKPPVGRATDAQLSDRGSGLDRPGKQALLETFRPANFYDFVGEVRKVHENRHVLSLYVSDYTQNPLLYDYKKQNSDRIEVQKDGDEYGYINHRPHKLWRGPFGKMTIQITLWEPHHSYALKNIKEGDVVYIRNVHTKMMDQNPLEGALRTDHVYPERVGIRRLKLTDPMMKTIVDRREQYWLAQENQERRPLSKAEKKKVRKKKKDQDKALVGLDEAEGHIQKNASTGTGLLTFDERDSMNKQAACTCSDKPVIPLFKILETPHLKYSARDGTEQTLPFLNMRCHARVRVVDFFPTDIRDFARSVDSQLYNDKSSQYESSSLEMDDDYLPRSRWEWAFFLLVEDAKSVPGKESVKLPLLVAGLDAEYLLKIDAVDLRHNMEILDQLKRKLFTLWGDLAEKKEVRGWTVQTKPSNRPFDCCILEYGVPEGGGWRRMHRITETTIH